MISRRKTAIIELLAGASIIAIWGAGSLLMQRDIILPDPVSVFLRFLELAVTPRFLESVGATLVRGISGFFLAAVPGTVFGYLSGRSPSVKAAVSPVMLVLKSTPVLSVILLALIWFGTEFVPVFAAFLMALPIVTASVEEGIKSVDGKILEMAATFSFTKKRIIRSIYVPHALPFFTAGAGSALSLTWKVVIAAEILSQPLRAIGTGMQNARVMLETRDVFAWTLASILLCTVTDSLFRLITQRLRNAA